MNINNFTFIKSVQARKCVLAVGAIFLVLSSGGAWSQTLNESGLKQAIIRYDTIHHPIKGRFGMVVSQNSTATRVGQEILASGGNAVDAAVAVGFALAVTLPRAGNLGGSGFMLAHMAAEQKTVSLDYRSMAPKAANIEKYSQANGEMDFHIAQLEQRRAFPFSFELTQIRQRVNQLSAVRLLRRVKEIIH